MPVSKQPKLQPDLTHLLTSLMQQVGLSNFKELCQVAGVSKRQLGKLRRGEVSQMRVETLVQIGRVLKVSLDELVEQFGGEVPTLGLSRQTLLTEYERSQQQLVQQRETLQQEFQTESLRQLESFLTYWSAAEYQAKNNPEFPAVKLLPLVKPIYQLLGKWGVDAIAEVGSQIPFDPQCHRLIQGNAQPGDLVQVRNAGYRQGERLILRVKVSEIKNI